VTAPRGRRAPRFSLSLFAACSVVGLLQCGAQRAGLPVRAAPSPAALRGSEASVSHSVHVALGTPRDGDPSDEYFLDQSSFVLSYSPEKRVPNWVAWQLDRTYLGQLRRRNQFRSDRGLPARFYRVNENDYLHSGYDRGHMCPSADRQASRQDNARTFLFTNIEPQLHELNAGPWEKLESYSRRLAQRGSQLFVVAGGIFGTPFETIGNGVAVPTANFKIIVVLSSGQGPRDVNERTPVLAVLMPNRRGVGDHDWTEYLTSVDAVERASGYDFLSAIPEHVQRVIEARTASL